MPIGPIRALVTELQRRGLPVTLHSYPGLGHAIGPRLWRDLQATLQGELEALQARPPAARH
ncbi:MAG: hypothetical protein FJ125_14690 [Deltaproteobacteria bacterium]|nr:hypothetical protein [Deltaproteobacteria bacterium]